MEELKGKYCKDAKVFADTIEDEALSTIHDILSCKAFDGRKVRIMPDVHQGKGIVIGFSSDVDIDNGFVSPAHVGCDIGCEVSAYFFDKPIPEDKYAEFEHRIRKEIPFGGNIHDESQCTIHGIIKCINSSLDRLVSRHPSLAPFRPALNSEKDLTAWCRKVNIDLGKFMKSLGSVGGNNHFIEYDVNEELEKYAVTVHCGSRNLGMKVFSYWDKQAKNTGPSKDEIKEITKRVKSMNKDRHKLGDELKAAIDGYKSTRIEGYLSGDSLKGYIIDMCIAQAYAAFNHMVINLKLRDIYAKVVKGARVTQEIHTTHNYIDLYSATMMIRKGAVRAMEGDALLIPFNMRDGIAVCTGKGNKDWNYTAPHGAGRLFSRAKARELLNVEDFKKTMQDAGIYTTTADASTIDEAPAAYKPMEEIVRLIEPTVGIEYFLVPKINIKAAGD